MPTFSRSLEKALHRALALANERRHEYATLEHLLLSLTDDKDAAAVMKASGARRLVCSKCSASSFFTSKRAALRLTRSRSNRVINSATDRNSWPSAGLQPRSDR